MCNVMSIFLCDIQKYALSILSMCKAIRTEEINIMVTKEKYEYHLCDCMGNVKMLKPFA